MSKEKNNNKKVNNGVFASLKIINKVKNIFDALLQYKSLVIFAVPVVKSKFVCKFIFQLC